MFKKLSGARMRLPEWFVLRLFSKKSRKSGHHTEVFRGFTQEVEILRKEARR
ncbi:hypothetical protein [Roseibium sp. RKSG952]|uniref:hypothetical protein n=1 Tax=Roseibium sp. RKSG952 TaxID=2529384 RepID=UPI0012BC7A57|nr:hypothetical protein [Roseibium sp. RKSG952]